MSFIIANVKRFLFFTGYITRRTGQALDRLGCAIQGNLAHKKQLPRHCQLMSLYDREPIIKNVAFIAPSASLIGAVEIGDFSSIWYGAVLRGDVSTIKVGSKTSIGDHVTIHVSKSSLTGPINPLPTVIGNCVTVAQGSVIHACTLEDECVVDVGSVVLDGATVSHHSILGPGSMLLGKRCIPPGEYWSGSPAKFVRKLSQEEKAKILELADKNFQLGQKYNEFHTRTCAED